MFEKLIKKFMSFVENLVDEWDNGNYLKLVGKLLLFGVASLIVILPTTAIVLNVYNFVATNWETLFLVGGAIFITVFYIKEHFATKQKELERMQEQERKLQEEADSKLLENNYRLLRSTLFEVTSYIHDVIHVKRPTMETELNSPNHVVKKLNFVLYQYILYPLITTDIDTENLKKVLQQEYARRLDSQSFTGIGQSYYFYEGQAEPIISVYEIVSNGAYLTVSLAIADENYCRHIRQTVSANLLQQAEQIRTPKDRDF